MVNQVWKDKGLPKGLINKEVTTAFAKKLYSGVETGFGKSLSQLDYDTPDFNMLKSLQENTWQFAAAKNYTQLRELSNALLDENGKLRSFNDFKTVANSINDKHIGRYLKAEYEHAVSSSQMASKWVDIEKNKPKLLEFDAVLDAGTSQICSNLNGTRLPYTHQFWSRYYPPNHFGCRSTVRELYSGVATEESKIPTAKIQELFQTNLAKDGLVYPKGHSYYKDMPADVMQTLNSQAKIFAKQAIYELPREQQFTTIYESKSGGKVLQHKLHLPKPKDSADDYLDNIKIAKEFANKGNEVELLPEIHVSEKEARALIFKNYTHKSANPDFNINGIYYDNKRPETAEGIKDLIKDANKQDAIAIISDNNFEINEVVIKETQHYLNVSKAYKYDFIYLNSKGMLIKLNRKGLE